jgi:hypothetical protein
MINIFILYIVAVLLTVAIVNTWANTTFKIYLCELYIRTKEYLEEVNTCEEWEDYMLLNHGKIGELLVCHICLSHWVGLFMSLVVLTVSSTWIWWFPLLVMFTAPFFVSKLVD